MIRFGMHSSLWTSAWTREGAELSVADAARHGLDIIEIALLEPDKVDVDHSRALFKRHNVAPTASLGLPIEAEATQHPEKAQAFLMRALEVSHALGSNTLCGVIYSTLGYRTGAAPTDREYDAIARALKPVARRAADYGMTLGLEACNRYETHLVNTARQALDLAKRINEPAMMIHLDTYHTNIEEKGFAAALEEGAGLVRYVHLSESDRGVPGSGNIDWKSVMIALKGASFDGDLVVESFVNMPPQLASALSVWRPVARDRDEVLDIGLPYIRSLARATGLAIREA
ncbi:sugar phosphate isomerase/epimerase [Methylocapsa sp. S129]|uniref:sugar phosphate isomerase/epimerase family protein n=1 Tax=Methylocapsa sp. S129 TaxID=1641869 RepID=UPI00131C0D9C|nr:sugar phosphate isomerase/epimerase [Methylocapsa sp. S129]